MLKMYFSIFSPISPPPSVNNERPMVSIGNTGSPIHLFPKTQPQKIFSRKLNRRWFQILNNFSIFIWNFERTKHSAWIAFGTDCAILRPGGWGRGWSADSYRGSTEAEKTARSAKIWLKNTQVKQSYFVLKILLSLRLVL